MDIKKLTASIQVNEGLRLKPYIDTTGHISIGYGRNLNAKGISTSEAAFLLGDDIQDAITACEGQPWWDVVRNDDVRSRALVEMCFNMGIGGLRTFTHALAALSAGDFAEASAQFLNSQWASQVGNRAKILAQMIETGKD